MPRKRRAKGTHFKAADWDKFIQVKKGDLPYRVQNPATPEERIRYSCGVVPFGLMWDTTADAINHVEVSISQLGASMLKTIDATNGRKIFGIEADATKFKTPPKGFYPALTIVSVRQASATRPENRTTSQISTRQYYKWRPRSAQIPTGRGDQAFVNADNESVAIDSEDKIDFLYMKKSVEKRVLASLASNTALKKHSLSFQEEIWQPVVGSLPALSTLTTVPDLSFGD